MWGTVLAIALIAALDPFRLGIAFLLISQRRPVRSLLAYWLGAMVAAIVSAMALLTLLRNVTPRLTEHVVAMTGSSTVGYVQIGVGLVALPLAVLVATGVFPRRRTLEMAGGPTPLFQGPRTPGALARLSSTDEARHRRAFWFAFVAGVVSATPPVEYLIVIAVILGSGAAMETQFSAAVIFIVVALAAIEIPLISCMLKPEKGEALMLRLHDWSRMHARKILALAFAIGGTLLLVTGVGST